jgi:hypothetical protein
MTQDLHCAVAKSPWQHHRQHDSTASSSAWVNIYTLLSNHLGSFITSMTWQHHHQHDSALTSCNNLIVNINDI